MQVLKQITYQLTGICPKKLPACRFFIALLLVINSFISSAQPSPSPGEYQLKAVFLFNFTQFVDWPPGSFSSAQEPMIIGVLGKDPFGSYLKETVTGEKMNGHPLVVQHFNTVEEVVNCHILFVNLSETKKLEKALTTLKGRNILTVGDDPDFLKQGGMIRFFNKENKIKLEVNLDAAKAANLIISSKLLRLVDIFKPK